MEWIGSLAATLVLFLLVVPMVVAVGSIVLLGAASWIASPSVARAAFYCPFSRRRVTAEFVTLPAASQPSDVLSCSRFADKCAVTCGKGCVRLAATGWTASWMEPRYALLSGDVAYRPVASPAG
jgi:hypothetical protein